MKRFSTVRDTQRFTELQGEEKREEGDRGDPEEERGVKREESRLASNRFPVCSAQPGTYREIHTVKQRGEGGGKR